MSAADTFGWATYIFGWKDNLEGKEAIINFLLDRGANASDADYMWDFSRKRSMRKTSTETRPYTMQPSKNYGNYGQDHTVIFQFLCDRGADSSTLNKDGETSLHSLCSYDGGLPIDTAVIEILLDHGAKVTDTDSHGNTPLHLADKKLDNLDAIVVLLDHGADISVKNLKGNTPLHEAANGMFWPSIVKEKYKSMGQILRRLQGDEGRLMDALNAEEKSPRQIQDEVRKDLKEKMDDIEIERKWWESEGWKK
ncbi:ankyrin [Fusarium mundagurra]|uniref:Ankyrin n=1 Tax=Fusarium mundagurra TaxID=1567541 RepID=A0A8H5YD17_9HYPO|nr:ankyrin [Fusarium mundagurra]